MWRWPLSSCRIQRSIKQPWSSWKGRRQESFLWSEMSLSFGFHFKWLRPLPLIGAFLLPQNVTETGTASLCLQATRYGSSWQQTLTSQQKKYCVLWVTIHRGHRQKLYFIYTLIVAMRRAPWSVQFSLWTAFFFKKKSFRSYKAREKMSKATMFIKCLFCTWQIQSEVFSFNSKSALF